MSGRARSSLRATIVAIAVVVLLPAWVARTVLTDTCAVRQACCGHAAKVKAKPIAPEAPAVARRACCATERVELHAAPSGNSEPALVTLPAPAATLVAIAAPARACTRLIESAPRATGPPPYLSRLLL